MKTKDDYVKIRTEFLVKVNLVIKNSRDDYFNLCKFSQDILLQANYEEYIIYTFFTAISDILPDNKKSLIEDQYNRYQLYYLLWIETLKIEFNELENFFKETNFNDILDITNKINKVFETTIRSLEPINKPNLIEEGVKALADLIGEYIEENYNASFPNISLDVLKDPFNYTNVKIKQTESKPKTTETPKSTPKSEETKPKSKPFDPNLFKSFQDFEDLWK